MIIIHIGMGKCGSSTLQNFLCRNEDSLRAKGVDYPKVGRKPHHKSHHNIANEIQDDRRDLFDPKSGALSDLVRHYETQGTRTTVLSSEMFKNAGVSEITRLIDAFDVAVVRPDFAIVLVIRHLSELVRSAYVKMVKYGKHVYDFDEYFSRIVQKDVTDYFEIGQRWAGVFGWPSMEVRLLHPRHLLNGDLLDDFMALAAPDIRIGAPGGPERTSPRNISPGWKTVEAIRALYSSAPVLADNHPLASAVQKRESQKLIGEAARKLGDLRGWNKDKGAYMTSEQAEFCLEKYRAAITSFNRHLSRKLPLPNEFDAAGCRERVRPPAADMIPASELREFYDDLWRDVSRKLERRKSQ